VAVAISISTRVYPEPVCACRVGANFMTRQQFRE